MLYVKQILEQVADNDRIAFGAKYPADRCKLVVESLERQINYLNLRGGLIATPSGNIFAVLKDIAKQATSSDGYADLVQLFEEIIVLHEKAYMIDGLKNKRQDFFLKASAALRKKHIR